MFADAAVPVRPDLHVRAIRGQPAPGLGDLRGHGRSSWSSARSSPCTAETAGNPLFPAAVDQALGNMEGKEIRFGSGVGGLFAAVTTGTSTGAINSLARQLPADRRPGPALQHRARRDHARRHRGRPLRDARDRGDPAVFIAGLMVGRTPEYLGKKVEAYEMKMAMLAVLVLGASILGFTALGDGHAGRAWPGRSTPGPHGFSEILYAFSSQTGNNGSAFAGLTGNTPFYNITGAFAMLIGRYGMIVPILALAGSMAAKRRVAAVARHVPDDRRPVGRAADRRDHHRRRPDVLPRALARTDRRAAPPERRKGLLSMSHPSSPSTCRAAPAASSASAASRGAPPGRAAGGAAAARAASSTRSCCGPRCPSRSASSTRALLIRNPVMFVVEITAALVTLIALAQRDRASSRRRGAGRASGFQVQIADLAVVHRPLRHVRGGDRRGARPGPGRHACAGRAR